MQKGSKRRRVETKEDLLRWLWTDRNCKSCKAAKLTAAAEALANLKEAHIKGKHGAVAMSGDSTASGAVGTSGDIAASLSGIEVTQSQSSVTPALPSSRLPTVDPIPADEASKLLRASPCSADREVFVFQQPLIKVITHKMPMNDKFDAAQTINPCMRDAVAIMIKPAQKFKETYKTMGEEFGEMQDRPHMLAVAAGLTDVVPTSEQVAAQEVSVKYMEKVRKPDGSIGYVEKKASPDVNSIYEYASKKQNKRWVMDILMFAFVLGAWVPRVLAECKWSLKPEDIYQAALGGARLMLDRLKTSRTIERLYLKVWAATSYRYAILDVFGYVRVENGKITPESFKMFKNNVVEQRKRCGDSFQEEAFKDCTTSLDAMEKLFLERDQQFQNRFSGVSLPDASVPVGVLYISGEVRPFPTGSRVAEEKDACLFTQGMLRVLAGNSVLGWDIKQVEANTAGRVALSGSRHPMIKWEGSAL